MKHLLLTLALLAPLALAACDNNSSDTTTTSSIDVPNVEPAAGDAAVDATATTTDAAEPATTSDTMTTTTPSGDTVTTTTTTTTEAAPAIAVGEPNPATPAADANSCGDHSAWVGKKKADIQTELDAMGDKVRVMYPDSAATMDFRADRVNVILEKDTDVVTEVRCG